MRRIVTMSFILLFLGSVTAEAAPAKAKKKAGARRVTAAVPALESMDPDSGIDQTYEGSDKLGKETVFFSRGMQRVSFLRTADCLRELPLIYLCPETMQTKRVPGSGADGSMFVPAARHQGRWYLLGRDAQGLPVVVEVKDDQGYAPAVKNVIKTKAKAKGNTHKKAKKAKKSKTR